MVGGGTYAAFSGTTSNASNQFSAGTVSLTDNDNNGAMLTFTNQRPGTTSSACIKVTYSGSLTATVKMYAAVTGTLGPYVDLKITRGTDSSPNFSNCTNFTPDASNYSGLGPGVIYNSTLSAFPSTYTAAVSDPAASWAPNATASYMFTVDIADNNAAQGLTAGATFTWEARS
jgi:hypothetical protein